MKCNKKKCQFLCLGKEQSQDNLGVKHLESIWAEKDLVVQEDTKLALREKCTLTAKAAPHLLGCIGQSFAHS